MKNKLFVVLLFIIFIASDSFSTNKYWVYFKDKGAGYNKIFLKGSAEYSVAISLLSERTIKRRMKVLAEDRLVDYQDLPVNEAYIESVKSVGGILHQKIKWMNAASFTLNDDKLVIVKNLPFVKKVTPVFRLFRRDDNDFLSKSEMEINKYESFDYGPSFAQYSSVKIPEVHQLGITGDSVIIGMLDTGFRWRNHESLQNTKVIREWDFINNDDTTANQMGEAARQDEHGTLTMSIIGSYFPGKIVAPAFNAYFLLAKTEYLATETQIEEDWWAAGIEWLENNGADVVSSSLGYSIFDDGSGYLWENGSFDGKTAVTTKAAVRAARLGVVVVTAMGNEGNGNGIKGTLLAPADADSILSVGAITISGTLAYFSSTGPTNDGRIKPDIVSPGVGIYSAVIPGPSTYGYSQGTSASTPITAGVVALLLSARPDLTPVQVRDIIRYSADRVEQSRFPNHPNNFVGWGRVNALSALSYPTVHKMSNAYYIANFIGNPTGVNETSVKLLYSTNDLNYDTLLMSKYYGKIYTTNGAYRAFLPDLVFGTKVRFWFEYLDSLNNKFRIPIDTNKLFTYEYGTSIVILDVNSPKVIPDKFLLLQNYPNPFPSLYNPGTIIQFISTQETFGTITVYNMIGQKIMVLHSGRIVQGKNYFYWNTQNENGIEVPSGVYFYRINTPLYSADKKMLLIR